ncbi:uncharacterized protein LOC120526126 isoform X2 [Polypterus senegalus]|nr:uncharacterized protein LOC120526126 isoform X2 [Polypterus senegalus]
MCSLVLTIIMICLPDFELIIIMLVLEIIGIVLFLLWKLNTHHTWPTNLKQPLISKGLWSYSRQVTIETQNIDRTLNSGSKFLEKLSTQLSNKGINLSTKKAEMFSSNMLMVFCPVVSRIGTDIKAALEGIPTEKRVILVVMHHTPNPKLVISDSRTYVDKPNILETVDCLFHEQNGFYDCNTNVQAIQSVSGALEKVSGECPLKG